MKKRTLVAYFSEKEYNLVGLCKHGFLLSPYFTTASRHKCIKNTLILYCHQLLSDFEKKKKEAKKFLFVVKRSCPHHCLERPVSALPVMPVSFYVYEQ